MKNTAGLDTPHGSILIVYIVTNDDGSLKIKQIDDFCDSKVYLDLSKSMGEAIAAAQANK